MNKFNNQYNKILEEIFSADVKDVDISKIYDELTTDGDYREAVEADDVDYEIILTSYNLDDDRNEDASQITIEFAIKDAKSKASKEQTFKKHKKFIENLIGDFAESYYGFFNNYSNEEDDLRGSLDRQQNKKENISEDNFVDMVVSHALELARADEDKYSDIIEKLKENIYIRFNLQPDSDLEDSIFSFLEAFESKTRMIIFHGGTHDYYENIASQKTLLRLFSTIRSRITNLITFANSGKNKLTRPFFQIDFSGAKSDESRIKLYTSLAKAFVRDLNKNPDTIYEGFSKWELRTEDAGSTLYYEIYLD